MTGGPTGKVSIRPMQQADLPAADRIIRLAFGTFLGIPDPLNTFGDSDFAFTRWRADPEAALAAELEGELVGSNFATNWGSVGFFGPLSVRPDLWDHGIASRLLVATMELFERLGTKQIGLFTFPQSAKHVHLYQKFGFWPQYLTPVMSKAVPSDGRGEPASRYSVLGSKEQAQTLSACRAITAAIFPGLDLTREIRAVEEQKLGDTVLLQDRYGLRGFAVCHCGAGTEAGSGTCFVKFGAVQPGPSAGQDFERLLEFCEALAAAHGLPHLEAGVNTARHDAYRTMLDRGFRSEFLPGVIMQRPNEPGYCRPDAYVIDDWR